MPENPPNNELEHGKYSINKLPTSAEHHFLVDQSEKNVEEKTENKNTKNIYEAESKIMNKNQNNFQKTNEYVENLLN